jgi:hypothetical protein
MSIFNVVDRTLLPPQHNYFNDLRRSYREGGAVKNETLGNLSHLPDELVEIIRAALQGTTFVPLNQAFEVIRSRSQGAVEAVALTMQRLGFATLIASKPCREHDIVLAIVAARLVAPHTKLATTRWWHTTTLAEDFEVADASEDELYAAGLAASAPIQDREQTRQQTSATRRWRE